MNKDERMKNQNLYEEYNNICYMRKSLSTICAVKHGKLKMTFSEFLKD